MLLQHAFLHFERDLLPAEVEGHKMACILVLSRVRADLLGVPGVGEQEGQQPQIQAEGG